jgi:hypothetical protein
MICKVALLMPEAEDPKKLRKNAQKVIDRLLEGFSKP